MNKIVNAAQAYANELAVLSDGEIRLRFRAQQFPTLATLPEALALAREAATRSLGLKPYPVQLMAAAALFEGVFAEMKTGEGKTLAIALAASVAALSGKGVHVATPNPYLALRDTAAMRPLYEFLGLTVGTTLPGLNLPEKRAAYAADILYGVHSEFGFDYLRDHLVAKPEQKVQRELHFVIVDEADSILVDEARTPLIITEPSNEHTSLVYVCDRIARDLSASLDVTLDPKARSVHLTECGFERVAHELKAAGLIPDEQTLYRAEHLHLMRYLEAALRARFVYEKNRDYVVHNGEVLIVDEATGRTLTGRRWQSGVHQALEAAQNLQVQPESETVAEITYQSYFGLYSHLSGLTGTALAAAEEFEELYARGTLDIPTHRPMVREDLADRLYSDRATKFHAIVDDVFERHARGQPVLVGTSSVEESEALSRWFKWAGLSHRVLNARQNAEEADIIRDAGKFGAITIATNMAGRGTDIVLGGTAVGGDEEAQVIKAGGLHVIGSQRQESRRVDEQLRGRAGRQGNPGSSRFYVSLEDTLLRVFGAQHFEALRQLLSDPKETYAQNTLIDKAVHRAQSSMEALAFEARRTLVKTDRILGRQRAEVYALRESLLAGEQAQNCAEDLISNAIGRVIDEYLGADEFIDEADISALQITLETLYHLTLPEFHAIAEEPRAALKDYATRVALKAYRGACESTPEVNHAERERLTSLTALDRAWREHLTLMDSIREGMHLKGYAQQNPDHVFAKDAREAFETFRMEYENHAAVLLTHILDSEQAPAPTTPPAQLARVSRLSSCPCGSQRRFKHCHGQLASA